MTNERVQEQLLEEVLAETALTSPLMLEGLLDEEALLDGSYKRIGIMGGTFDPIHFGHLFCAEQARQALDLDVVLFVPAGLSAFKTASTKASRCDRLAMCRLALADNPHFVLSLIEVVQEGVTYTVDTLRTFREYLPSDTELVFILGADALCSLALWERAQELATLATFACVARPDTEVEPGVIDELEAQGFRLHIINEDMLAISSSIIRDRVARKRSIRYLCPLPVCDYIRAKELYVH